MGFKVFCFINDYVMVPLVTLYFKLECYRRGITEEQFISEKLNKYFNAEGGTNEIK